MKPIPNLIFTAVNADQIPRFFFGRPKKVTDVSGVTGGTKGTAVLSSVKLGNVSFPFEVEKEFEDFLTSSSTFGFDEIHDCGLEHLWLP